MARIRTIKPEFFTSEDIVSLTPLARVFYIALWCEADREGRLTWKPKTLKMRYLPGDNCDIDSLAQELIDGKQIELYEVDGVIYAEIPGFSKHQMVNNRESDSHLPARVKDASTRVKAEGRKEGKGKEGKEVGASLGGETSFDVFWKAYPKKVGKDDARKSFDKRKPDAALVIAILRAVEQQKSSPGWLKDGGQYIPNPATWLNQGRWQDEGQQAGSAQGIFAGSL